MSEENPVVAEVAPPPVPNFIPQVTFETIDLETFALFKTRVGKDTRHTIFTAKDKSTAYYIAEGKVGKKTSKDALAFINEAKIPLDAHGQAELQSYLLAEGKRGGHTGGVLIAKGSAPINGVDGYIEWHVTEPESFGVGKESGGAVDYRERQTFSKVTKGMPVLTWHPPTHGTPGRDIFGKEIDAIPGQMNKPRAGVNISTDGEGKHMSASIDGVVKLEEDAIHVRLMLEVMDVDFGSGNIRFDGDVQVNGVVKEGFEVVSEGAVQIIKGVTKASVIARTLFVEGPASGATLEAAEHGEVKNLESSKVRTGRALTINGDAVNATIHVGADLKAAKARISGGEINALGVITLGAIVSGETEVASDPRSISLPELDEVDTLRSAISEAITKIDAALNQEEEGEKPKLSLQQKAALNALRKKREGLVKDLEEADKKRRIALSRKMKEMKRGIVVLDGIKAGARLRIDQALMEIEEDLSGPWNFTLSADTYYLEAEPLEQEAEE